MRVCGECTVCCVYPRIPELDKEGMRHCIHVIADEEEIPGERVCYTGKGCSIYGKHPETCQKYLCEWRRGRGADADRPDRCGVLIDRNKGIGNAVECKPLWQNAANQEAGAAAIKRIAQDANMAALVLSFYESRLMKVVCP
jgi:hypothetical protein